VARPAPPRRTIRRTTRTVHPSSAVGGAWDADPRSNPTGDPAAVAAALVEWFTPDEAQPS